VALTQKLIAMRNHFNSAANGYRYIKKQNRKNNYSVWEENVRENHWHKTSKWSCTTSWPQQGFGGTLYKIIIEEYDYDRLTPPAPRVNPATVRATEIVNNAFAEALAESTATTRPSFFSRLLGRKP
jgi:hypothetical protein